MGVRCEGVKGDDRRLRLFLLPPLVASADAKPPRRRQILFY